MKIVPAAAHADWHVPLKISKKSIHPNHCCVLKHAFLRRAITASTSVTSAAFAPTTARRRLFIFCADNCPEEAIHLKNGAFIVDPDACTGCLICVEVCPHHVMFEQKNSDIPVKCNLCGECAQTCPRNAIVWVEEQESAVA
jgi:ferredoxin